MRCSACQATDGRPVFRTNPPGQRPAGWLCQACIQIHHHPSLIEADTQELVDLLASPTPHSAPPLTTPD